MVRLTFTFILIIIYQLSFGQTEFNYQKDFKRILTLTKDSLSASFYPKLLERFFNNDTTLTENEVLSLMIGFTENQNYRPYKNVEKERQIQNLIFNKKYNEALEMCNTFLKTNPLNLMANTEKWFVYYKQKRDSVSFYNSKLSLLMGAIHYSGNGTIQKPYFILSPLDGQTIINYFYPGKIGSMGSGEDKNGNFCDILEFIPRDGSDSHDIYFNIQHAIDKSEIKKRIEEGIEKYEKEK